MVQKNEVKNLINTMSKTVGSAGNLIGVKEADALVRYDLAMFMMYLAASDGEIKWSEASTISELCNLDLTPQTIGTFIRENNIYSVEFENKIPVTVELLVTVDNKLVEMNVDDIPELSGMIIGAYREIYSYFVNADGDVDSNEENDGQIYINMIEKYICENSLRKSQFVSGFVKDSGAVNAPAKSGVSAPKKKG